LEIGKALNPAGKFSHPLKLFNKQGEKASSVSIRGKVL